MQALPRVTHGNDLCNTLMRHPSLMHGEELYASPNLHKTVIICDCYTISRGGFYAKQKSTYLAISLQLTMNLITTFSVTAAGKPLIICDICINPPLIII